MNYIQNFCIIRNRVVKSPRMTFNGEYSTIADFINGLYERLAPSYPKFYRMDTQSQLGFLASEILLNNVADVNGDNIALVLSNAEGSLDSDIKYQQSVKTIASPTLFVYTLPNIVAGEISIRHKLKGETAFFVSQAFDPQLMISYVDILMDTNAADVCVAGWVNVMGEQHDVLLYLVTKTFNTTSVPHDIAELEKIYLQ
jgi:hypothetical protein